jgi:hypothetical protein
MRRAPSGRAPRAAFLLPLEASGDGPPCVRHPAFGIAGRGEFPPRVRSPRLDPVSSPYGHVCRDVRDAQGPNASRIRLLNIVSQDKFAASPAADFVGFRMGPRYPSPPPRGG